MTPFLTAAVAEMLPGAGDATDCAECGFSWLSDPANAMAAIERGPGRFETLLAGVAGTTAPTPGVWSPSAYVWHVSDLVRAWAERLHSLAVDPSAAWAGFDPDELARARHYDALPQVSGPWAVARSVDALQVSLRHVDSDTAFLHPEWGRGTVTDALRWVAHEAVHHELDVRRGLERSG